MYEEALPRASVAAERTEGSPSAAQQFAGTTAELDVIARSRLISSGEALPRAAQAAAGRNREQQNSVSPKKTKNMSL